MIRCLLAALLLFGGQASAALYSLDFTATKRSRVLDLGDDASPSVRQGNALDVVTGRVLFRTDAPSAGINFGRRDSEGYVIEELILDQVDTPVEGFPDISINIEPSRSVLSVAQFGVNGTLFPELDVVFLRFEYSVPPADNTLQTLVDAPLAFQSGQLQFYTQNPGGSFPRYILFFDIDLDTLTLSEVTPGAEVPLPGAAVLFGAAALPFVRPRKKRPAAGKAP